MLTCINGLESIQRGNIRVDNVDVHARKTDINLLRQKIGIVFQQWNAFPHLTVLENVMLAPRKVLGLIKSDAEEIAVKQLTHVGLADKINVFRRAFPAASSSAWRSRARWLPSPRYMLFDEATSALDPQLVGEVLDTMRMLSTEGMTMIVVTHEMRFARDVSDRVAFFKDGVIHEIGTPEQVLDDPQRPETAQFLRSTH